MTQSSPSTSPGSIDPASDPDPLLHLHKMSTTAGLGSQEYVAVNTTSVVAVLFAIASILALLGSILLVIPVVGVILSLVALRQIRNSNGTQTGRGIAFLALALSAIITGGLFVRQGIDWVHTRADKAAISALCDRFGQFLKQRKFEDAYNLFDDRFRQRVPLQQFKDHFTFVQSGTEGQPTIDSAAWNGLIAFQTEDEFMSASSWIIDRFSTGQEWREPVEFRKQNDTWKFDNLPKSFPPEKKGRAEPPS